MNDVLTGQDEFRINPSNRREGCSRGWCSCLQRHYFGAMYKLALWPFYVALGSGLVACHSDDEPPTNGVSVAAPKVVGKHVQQVPPPLDLKVPPADAITTGSGLIYKRLVANDAGPQPRVNETALILYTGWRQRTGETFFTTKGSAEPMAIDIAHAAPGFAEALPLLHKGEKVVLWIPPGRNTRETIVYEVELVDIVAPPVVVKRALRSDVAVPAPVPR